MQGGGRSAVPACETRMLVTSTGGNVSPCARIVWFWRVRKVGQAGAEVPDLRGLTDTARRGDFGESVEDGVRACGVVRNRAGTVVGARSPAGGGDRRAGPTFGSGSAQGLTSRTTVSLALAPDGSVHVALKRTSTPPPAEVACPAPMEQPSAPPDARNWLMAPCIACSNAANWLMGNVPTSVQGRLIVPEMQIVTL